MYAKPPRLPVDSLAWERFLAKRNRFSPNSNLASASSVAVETRSIQGPWVDVTRTQQMLDIAIVAPCSVLLLPLPPEEGQWFAERPKPMELLYRPRVAANTYIQASGGIQ